MNMNMQLKARLAGISFALLTPMTTLADDTHHKPAGKAAGSATTTAAEMTDAEVSKVDVDSGKVTLKHGDIKNLDMPGMTMVFVVKEKTMLDKLKTGDKVKFRAINDAGKFTVTEIRPVR